MRGIREIPEHPVIRWVEATGYPRVYQEKPRISENFRGILYGADIIRPRGEREEIDEAYTE